MKPMRAGLSRCSGANLPFSSHHSSAMREKRSISAASTVPAMACPLSVPPLDIRRLRSQSACQRQMTAGAPSGLPLLAVAGSQAAQDRRAGGMARIVVKFGGTSVGDIDRLENVARMVQLEVERGHQVAVVVSAMSG